MSEESLKELEKRVEAQEKPAEPGDAGEEKA